jgi:hypothetical protein
VWTLVQAAKGGPSGGTIASVFYMAENEPVAEMTAAFTNAYYLAPRANFKYA